MQVRESPHGLVDGTGRHRRSTQRVKHAVEISRQPKIIVNGRSHREHDASTCTALLAAESAGQLRDVKSEIPLNAQRTSGSLARTVGAFRTRLGRLWSLKVASGELSPVL